jgi:hypothetical protein
VHRSEILQWHGAWAEAAEEQYQYASRAGREPQPGLALLRLRQGQVETATRALRRTVGEARDVLTRSRLLPAYVEVLLAGQEVSAARLAAEELTSAVESLDTPYLRAVAAHAIGAVRLAEGDANAALTALRGAWGHGRS